MREFILRVLLTPREALRPTHCLAAASGGHRLQQHGIGWGAFQPLLCSRIVGIDQKCFHRSDSMAATEVIPTDLHAFFIHSNLVDPFYDAHSRLTGTKYTGFIDLLHC